MAELPKIDSEGLRAAKREGAKRVSSVTRVTRGPLTMTHRITHIAIIERHDNHDVRRAVLVPAGQSIDFEWLWPYLGKDWHLHDFIEVMHADGEEPKR